MKEKVLCLDDDATIQALVEASLNHFEVICASSINEAELQLIKHKFDCVLADIQLPDGDGLRFAHKILQNESTKSTPVLIFSNHKEISNKVMAFNLGADDFIEKPFDPIELRARVEARVQKKKSYLEQQNNRRVGNLLLDKDRQKAFFIQNGNEIDLQLTSYELKILNLLSRRLEQVFSREQILQDVWGQTHISDRTVDSHVAHLRQKLSETQLQINTVKNFGYSASLKKN